MIYQEGSNFSPISKANVASYEVLRRSEGLAFLLHPGQYFGFVFSDEEIQCAYQHVTPVMFLALRDSCLGYKQASWLRVRRGFSGLNVAAHWYLSYVEKYGGIVSGKECLEGSREPWESLLGTVHTNSRYEVLLGDVSAKKVAGSATAAHLEQIWSSDDSHINLVLVLKKAE